MSKYPFLNRNFAIFILITALSIGALMVYAMNNMGDTDNNSNNSKLGNETAGSQNTDQVDDQTLQNFDLNKQPSQQQDSSTQDTPGDATQDQSDQNQKVNITSPTPVQEITEVNELKIEDLVVGNGGEVKSGDTVEVHYTGTFLDGTKFDSSVDRNQTFDFTVGAGEVIQGWDQGLVGMKVGGKRILLIPSDLAYGERGAPGAIPPNTPLKFEIQLISIK